MMKNQVAIVTGGSRGIGKAVCLRLAREGVHIILNYTSNLEAAEETAAECKKQGVTVAVVQADVSKAEACEKLFDEALKINGRVDILVNNAGITRDNLLIRMKEEEFDAVIATNLRGTFLCMRNASKIMMKQRYGRIINMSSVIGLRGNAGQVNYAASKAGVIGMTKSLAKELAARGVTVNAVAPGMIETDMTNVLSEQIKENICKEIPMKKMGTTEDIAETVLFFAKEEAAYITGQVLCVDGGMAV
jgi:3-oxoacyl-[acyl-carrier protein] reductase